MKISPALLLLCACHSAPANLITSFTASPAAVSDGQPVTLHAEFHGGTGSVGGQAIASGVDLMVAASRPSGLPQETVTFTLAVTVSGAIAQTATASVVVTRLPSAPLISARTTVRAHEENLVASVTPEDGATYTWTITGGTAAVTTGSTITYTAGEAGTLTLNCTATNRAGAAELAAPVAARVVGVALIAGSYTQAGRPFTALHGVAVDAHDTIFVTDTTGDGASFVRSITAGASGYTVATIAGHAGAATTTDCTDGFGSAAYFADARDLIYDRKQDELIVAEHGAPAGAIPSTSRVRLVTSNGTTSTAYVAADGDPCGAAATTVATLDQVSAVALDPLERVWAATDSGAILNLAAPSTSVTVPVGPPPAPIGHIAFASDGALIFSPALTTSLQRAATLSGTFAFGGFVGGGFPSTDGAPGETTVAAAGALVTSGAATIFVDGDLLRRATADGAVTTLLGAPALTRQTLVPLAPGELDAQLVGVAALSTGDLLLITRTAVLLARLPEGAL